MRLIAESYISPKGAFLNGKCVHVVAENEANWLKSLYVAGDYDYPKFHKMDNLSKLSFLAAELLAPFIPAEITANDELQLIFANASSSARTDLKFIDSYENQGNPSPSLFVYTLPNIVTGELSIRHKWYGENIFLINERFDANNFIQQANFAFLKGNKLCLCGWVDTTGDHTEECFLFLISVDGSEELSNELTNRLNNYRNE